MSRGIFRRFLRYVLLVIASWEKRPKPRGPIDLEIVRKAVTVERLAEDMELELVELFPRQSELRFQAVQLLLLLEESSPRGQKELAEELGVAEYALSRVLGKLESHRYIVRRWEGKDKVVSLRKTEQRDPISPDLILFHEITRIERRYPTFSANLSLFNQSLSGRRLGSS